MSAIQGMMSLLQPQPPEGGYGEGIYPQGLLQPTPGFGGPSQQAKPPSMIERIMDRFRPKAPAGYEGLLSQEEIEGARPGLLRSIISHPDAPGASDLYRGNLNNIVAVKQAAEQMQSQKKMSDARARIQAKYSLPANATREQQIEALRGMWADYAAIGDHEMVGKMAGYLSGVDKGEDGGKQYEPDKFQMPDGSIVWVEPGQPVPQGAKPWSPPSNLVVKEVQQEDGSVTYEPVAESVGKNAPSPTGRGSAAIAQKVASNQTQMATIADALKELDLHPDAVGLKRGVGELVPGMGNVGDALNQRQDPKGVAARASIMNIGSLVIHNRSGAAVTISEFPRLAPFVPRVSDTPEAIKTKLKKLRELLVIETDFLSKSSGRSTVNAAPTYEEWKKKRGGN